jgi:3-dehydroquinate synthase
VILDEAFFSWLEDHAADLVDREAAAVAHAVERSAAIKAGVVERDEREVTGLRAALNYGHTFGHAFETALGYGTLLHGEAVAIGMAKAARLAAAIGRIPQEIVDRQDRLLDRLRLPRSMTGLAPLDPASLIEIMGRDKKSEGGRLRFVLPSRLGEVDLVDGIEPGLVRQILAAD